MMTVVVNHGGGGGGGVDVAVRRIRIDHERN